MNKNEFFFLPKRDSVIVVNGKPLEYLIATEKKMVFHWIRYPEKFK